MKNQYIIHFRWLFLFLLHFIIFTFIFTGAFIYCDYPEIKTLTNSDPLFKQLQDDVSAYYRAAFSHGRSPFPALKIFQFTRKIDSEIDIFTITARLNIPYDTIASLNHIHNPRFFYNTHTILVPNMPGIFVPEIPDSDLEHIMLSWRTQSREEAREIIIFRKGKKEKYLFFPGKRFHPVERAYFLNLMFRFPLPKGRITSSFGERQDPFSGHKHVHNGIDIGATEGTEVYAVRAGIVKKAGYDKIYGNYVLIEHDEGYQSFYGHLKDFYVHLNMKVYSGEVIGRVGITGRSTGSHLHFEIRKNGTPKDPIPLLQKIEQ